MVKISSISVYVLLSNITWTCLQYKIQAFDVGIRNNHINYVKSSLFHQSHHHQMVSYSHHCSKILHQQGKLHYKNHSLKTLSSSSTTLHQTPSASSSSSGGFSQSSTKKKTTAASDDRTNTIQALVQWATLVGIKSKGINISSMQSAGLGLVTTDAITPNSVLLSVPTPITLSVSTNSILDELTPVESYYFTPETKNQYSKLPWYVKLSLQLNYLDKVDSTNFASSKQNSSDNDPKIDMKPWLNSLPRSFSTPIHWTKEETNELQYNHLLQAISKQNELHEKLYNQINNNNQLTFQDFVWGIECSRSRAFSTSFTGSAFKPTPYILTFILVAAYVGLQLGTMEQAANGAALVFCGTILQDFVLPKLLFKNTKKYVICPLIDMANHVGINEEGNVAFEYFGNGYSLSCTKSMPSKKELRISYGARSNDVLLQQYGFVECDNPHDVYVMPPLREWDIGALEEASGRKFGSGRLEKLDRAGLLGGTNTSVNSKEGDSFDDDIASNRGMGVVVSRAGGIDPAILTALRVLVSTEEEWKSCGEAVGNFVTENSGGSENERIARLVARKALELELESKQTSLEEDQALWKKSNQSMSDASRLALQFRMEKKKLLKETIRKLM